MNLNFLIVPLLHRVQLSVPLIPRGVIACVFKDKLPFVIRPPQNFTWFSTPTERLRSRRINLPLSLQAGLCPLARNSRWKMNPNL